MGKTCNVCNSKPKIGVKVANIKYLICNKFDQEHISFLKENKIVKNIRNKLKSRLVGGIIFAILCQFILIFLMWLLSFSLQFISLVIYFILLIVAIGLIAKFGNDFNRFNKGVSQLQSETAIDEEKFCPSCGFQSKNADKFCGKCGYEF